MHRISTLGTLLILILLASSVYGEDAAGEACHTQCLQGLDTCNVTEQTDCDQKYNDCMKACPPPAGKDDATGGDLPQEKEQKPEQNYEVPPEGV